GRIVAIAAAPPAAVRPFASVAGAEVLVLCDPERIAYHALGLGRASWARVWLDPRVWWRYAVLIARGRRPERPGDHDDVRQLGGDAVLDADGRLVWVYRGRGPADRPTIDELIGALRRAGA
ncbi:unnamed protein product, partial [Phaeothamnion confervicola]